MKNFTLLLALVTFSSIALSQPTLDSESFYNPGDQVVGFAVDPSGVNDGTDGANQTWDFSQFQTQGESNFWGGLIVHPSELSDFDLFSDANVAMVLNDGTIRYWSNDESGLTAIGQGGDHDILQLNDANSWLSYPFSYGSSISDEANGTLFGACNDFQWESVSETQGVGYGTLVLPSGTFENVLKIRRISFTNQINEEIGMERENNIVEHFWFQPGVAGPLLYMRSWSNNGCPGMNEGVEIVYTLPSQNTNTPNEISSEDITLSVFPNPASTTTHLNIRTGAFTEAEIWVSDLLGKNVLQIGDKEQIENTRLFDINLGILQPGVYVVNVKMNHTHFTERLVIQ